MSHKAIILVNAFKKCYYVKARRDFMQTYKIYVTNISQALAVLKEQGFEGKDSGTFIEIAFNPSQKMSVIMLLNQNKIVVYDIEEA